MIRRLLKAELWWSRMSATVLHETPLASPETHGKHGRLWTDANIYNGTLILITSPMPLTWSRCLLQCISR